MNNYDRSCDIHKLNMTFHYFSSQYLDDQNLPDILSIISLTFIHMFSSVKFTDEFIPFALFVKERKKNFLSG